MRTGNSLVAKVPVLARTFPPKLRSPRATSSACGYALRWLPHDGTRPLEEFTRVLRWLRTAFSSSYLHCASEYVVNNFIVSCATGLTDCTHGPLPDPFSTMMYSQRCSTCTDDLPFRFASQCAGVPLHRSEVNSRTRFHIRKVTFGARIGLSWLQIRSGGRLHARVELVADEHDIS